MNDDYYMMLAIKEAYKAEEIDEVPVGAVIVDENSQVIGQGFTFCRVDPGGLYVNNLSAWWCSLNPEPVLTADIAVAPIEYRC